MINLKKHLTHCLRDMVSFIFYIFIARRKRSGAVTLVYHSVDRVDPLKDSYRLNITPEKFEEHLKIISKSKDNIKITFDDGYGNNFENAFPLLNKYGCAATIFLITDFIDGNIKSGKFCGESLSLRPLTWGEIKIMDNSGIIFGSHSKTHPRLALLSAESIKSELLDSKKRIESELGHTIDSLAYPFGDHSSFNATVIKIAEETGFGCAHTNIMGVNAPDDKDRFDLKRVRIYSEDGPFKLKMKLSGAYDWIDAFFR